MSDEQWMREALALAREAAADGEVPVGCVVTHGERIVGRGRNRRECGKSALAHAELEAIAEACKTLGGWRLWQCALYVTLEPCPMCAGAILNAHIHALSGVQPTRKRAQPVLWSICCTCPAASSRRSRAACSAANVPRCSPIFSARCEDRARRRRKESSMRYKITADSTCDLGRDLIERYDIGILPLYVQLGDKTYRDGIDIQPDDIYAHVAAGGGLATTAAVNLADYVRAFTELSDRYDFVIHVNISSDFSCSHQNAKLAAADLPNVYVVDSRSLSTGHGHIVLEAARMAAEGMGPEEIVQQLEALTARVDASFILEQLEYMKKSGRCSAVALLGANLLKLRPCIEVKDGKMGVAKKYRGTFAKCLEAYIADRLAGRDDIELGRIFITHSGVPDEIIALAKSCIAKYQTFDEVCVTRAGCTVSSHCGPGTIGILFIRK